MPTGGNEQDTSGLYNIIDGNEPWKGRMLFTGPDATKDHQMTIDSEHRQVGIGTMSWEGTSEADYIWRPATGTPFHRSRSSKVGEVGWCVPSKTDWSVPKSGKQIMLGQFRQSTEDRHSHLYQNAWYPGPNDEIAESSDAALIMNVYRPKTSQNKTGRFRSTPSARRYRRTPAATPTTNYYVRHKYYSHRHPEEQETSDTNTSTQ